MNSELSELLLRKNGKCLSTYYEGLSCTYLWECEKGHQWFATGTDLVKRDSWCPVCHRNVAKDKLTNVLIAKNGRLIGPEFTSSKNFYTFECQKGHQWTTRGSALLYKNTWCPKCAVLIPKSKSEEICRIYIEHIFERKFPPATPFWLKNKKGNQLYLDGYNEEIQVAFEHQGVQHYEEQALFKKRTLAEIQASDLEKAELCKQQGILLVDIPALFRFTPVHKLIAVIIEQCRKTDFEKFIKNEELDTRLDISKLYVRKKQYYMDTCRFYAAERGGECLSTVYTTSNVKMKWKCEKGHVWEASFGIMKHQNSWCQECYLNTKTRFDLETCKLIAKLNEGECLNSSYEGRRTKLLLKCSCGEQWTTYAQTLLEGAWCPRCRRPRKENYSTKRLEEEGYANKNT